MDLEWLWRLARRMDRSLVVQVVLDFENSSGGLLGWVLKQGSTLRVPWFLGWRRFTRFFSKLLAQLCQLTSELGKLMLCVWICCVGRNPTVDEISNLLCRILGVIVLVKKLSILSGLAGGDLVQIVVSELRQELSHEHNCCDVSSRDQIKFTSMSQFAKPEVVGLLIQQGRHR